MCSKSLKLHSWNWKSHAETKADRYIYSVYRKSHLLSSYEKLSYCVIRVCERWVHVWSHLAADELMCDLKIGQKSPMSLHQNEALAFLKYYFDWWIKIFISVIIFTLQRFCTLRCLSQEVQISLSWRMQQCWAAPFRVLTGGIPRTIRKLLGRWRWTRFCSFST